jgi:hypothetical protein
MNRVLECTEADTTYTRAHNSPPFWQRILILTVRWAP